MIIRISLPLTIVFLASHSWSQKLDFPVEKFTLKNGLTVLMVQDRSVPLISYQTWYKVGSRNEHPGVTGAAHMLEHMMFKGAKKYSGKQFDRVLHENGIVNNAFTSWDYTGFYQKLPSSKLELMMDMEVDRMSSLRIAAEDLTSELQVVAEERRFRIDNNPSALAIETMMDLLYTSHPYRWPVIGYMNDIMNYTPQKLRAFYETYYTPTNAVLVLVGDLDLVRTKKLVEKYYGRLKARERPEPSFPVDPGPSTKVHKVVEAEVQSPTAIMGFAGVEASHRDAYALDLLANIEAAGSSSRLHQELVYRQQKALSVSVNSSTPASRGYIGFLVSLKPGYSADSVVPVLEKHIKALKHRPVSQKELEKAKNFVMKGFVDQLLTLDGKARALAYYEIIHGNYQKLFSELDAFKAVKAEDIQRVAKTYLNLDQRVLVELVPKKKVAP